MSNVNCPIELNPDVAGIGVRPTQYIQSLLAMTICVLKPSLLDINTALALFNGSILLAAAFDQHKAQALSLLDGIIVSFITIPQFIMIGQCFIQNVLEAMKKLSIPRKEAQSQLFRLASVLLQIVYLILWLLWFEKVFSDPLHFGLNGTNDQCSPNESVVIWSFTYLEGVAERKLAGEAVQMEELLGVIFGLVVLLNLAWVVYDILVVYKIISPLSIFPKEPPRGNNI
ncbi:hypothetical protein FRC11_000571, partial [Ceratobasidium sp. 423]